MTSENCTDAAGWQVARAYHEATKHHFARYARSLGYLDWASQPDPFRRYLPASPHDTDRTFLLPLAERDLTPPYEQLYTPSPCAPRTLTRASLAEFLEFSLAITAWKSFRGSSWALRANPSSGNLHPTEGYLVLPALEGLGQRPGVYHYVARDHSLELRTTFSQATWQRLAGQLPAQVFLAGLSSIHWREAWKYGERAYRYCQHDLGHALACLRLSAAALGWRLQMLDELADSQVARLLGLDRQHEFPAEEGEEPAFIAAVSPVEPAADLPQARPPLSLDAGAVDAIGAGSWQGQASRLSPSHVNWEIIGRVAQACRKPTTRAETASFTVAAAPPAAPAAEPCGLTAAQVIRQRRSCLGLDGKGAIPLATLQHILRRVMPDGRSAPWDALPWEPRIDLLLFVHRVDGLPPGRYALVRRPAGLASLRAALAAGFDWQPPAGWPADLPFFRLAAGDVRKLAATVSCHQDIAGDGALSLGMLADWEAASREHGAWAYRRLFWEAGAIGQVLYLEAEAAGRRGTGIGCYFDDAVHEAFGLRGQRFQSMYHFTLGTPVEDARLTTWPPYGRRQG